MLTSLEQVVIGRKDRALAKRPPPASSSQRGAALRLLGASGWGELDPDWKSRSLPEQEHLRLQWNAEAVGVLP